MLDHIEERLEALKDIESQMKLGKRMNEDGWIFVVRDAIAAMEELLQRENNPGKLLPPDFPHSAAIELLCSRDYKERAKGEYLFVKAEYEKLHRMIIKREAGKLDFAPNCPMEQWKAQAAAMGQYLYQLEVKAEIEGVEI